jgi:beta-lactamase regulating signal transducer with metallopeptidase domain
MTTIAAILNHPLVREVGWTLLHSLWQGALIGLVFVVLRVALRRRSANMRYLAGCACLVLLAAAPVLTLLLGLAAVPAGAAGHAGMAGATGLLAAGPRPAGLGTPFHVDGNVWRLVGSTDFLTRLAPALVLGWLLGVMFFSARLTRSCWSVRGIRTRDNEPVEAAWLEMLDKLRCRLGVSQPVRLLKSALVEVPTVIGCFRPVILLPAATLSGLTPGQLEAILAHELAHVRRLDYLVNAFQCLVETLMFYHPVAWWISRCIREERENCCDDLVVEVCSDRLGYARALATLEGLRAELPEVAFAASGGSLLNRIRRLVGAGNEGGRTTVREAGGLALLGIGLVLIILGVRMLLSPTNYQSAARIRIEHDQTDIAGFANHPGSASYDPYFL